MTRRIRLVALLTSAAASALCGSASSAGAAEVIGQTGTIGSSCTDDEAYVQRALVSGPGYSPSAPGVITSWTAAGDPDANQTVVLMVLRQDSATQFTSVGNDVVRTLTPNALNTFTGLNLPIQPGQLIAVYLPPGSTASCVFATGNPGDAEGYSFPYAVGLPPVGVPFDYSGTDSGFRINAQAVVGPTGLRGAALKKCKKKAKKKDWSKKRLKKCKRKARLLPI